MLYQKMSNLSNILVSVVVPLFNEADNLRTFHKELVGVLKNTRKGYEIIYVDDGSYDETSAILGELIGSRSNIKLIKFSRNFGKENALAAGIAEASGDFIITIDGDGQHPPSLIPKFIDAWERGAKVVVGVRENDSRRGLVNRLGAYAFYNLFNKFADKQIVPRSTDFRLIDKSVQKEFLKLTESDRLTRGLIDWLGFKRELIYFDADERQSGEPGYSFKKLTKLATHSFVSFTPVPLYVFGYLGFLITTGAFLLGAAVFVEQVLFGDPLGWNFTGTAMLSILILFLVGILLTAQGVLSLYITHIHSQTKNRPLYVIDRKESIGVKKV